ncbi:ER membrane protein complex subunit 8-like [Mytilus galloprovincialis]|uniref:ER membrane protein complex subunit 8-like n=1 Tax=Mytilus galloprovincialis TaxID=29158 RepID=UPI003F7CB0C5
MADLFLTSAAYCKILLHAAKYPHCAVNGVLLAEEPKNKDHKHIRFVDCIPLFHLSLSIAPMLEAALLQIEAYSKSIGCVIAGYYQANENLDDNVLNNAAKIIGKRIYDNNPDTCIFIVDNNKVSPLAVSEAYNIYTFKESNWGKTDKRPTTDEETLELSRMLLSTPDSYRQLVDFDNHFDDLSKDWRNLQIAEYIDRST